jgi:hypothetical protein
MRRRWANSRGRGFTVLEMLLLLPLLALFLGMVFWAFRAQMSTHKRLARQANRHAVMQSVLGRMRSDFAAASQLEFERAACMPADMQEVIKKGVHWAAGTSRQSLRLDVTAATVRLSTCGGTVIYRLRENAPLYDKPNDTNQKLPASPQTLVRVGADGDVTEWPLLGQTLHLSTDEDGPTNMLQVCFETRLRSEGGRETLRRFQTTLVAGGGR